MTAHRLDPLADPRWPEFLARHPDASVFHTRGWLEAVRRTYGYEPVAYTTASPGRDISSAIVVCRISSWLTGRRIVSLPFADHCEPLFDGPSDRATLLDGLRATAKQERWDYVELRPRSQILADEPDVSASASYAFHHLDLRPPLAELFARFHKSTIQRNIRRAEREGLEYHRGSSESLLKQFYSLMLLTRRRHQLPPQPIEWFRGLMAWLGDRLVIRVASKDGQPVASILTLSHGRTVVYKYGCSNAAFHHFGSMPFLFWKTIAEAQAEGMAELDLGRSDSDNAGLITFKERWGAERSTLTYVRCHATSAGSRRGYPGQVARLAFAHMPDRFLTTAGRLLYRHIG